MSPKPPDPIDLPSVHCVCLISVLSQIVKLLNTQYVFCVAKMAEYEYWIKSCEKKWFSYRNTEYCNSDIAIEKVWIVFSCWKMNEYEYSCSFERKQMNTTFSPSYSNILHNSWQLCLTSVILTPGGSLGASWQPYWATLGGSGSRSGLLLPLAMSRSWSLSYLKYYNTLIRSNIWFR